MSHPLDTLIAAEWLLPMAGPPIHWGVLQFNPQGIVAILSREQAEATLQKKTLDWHSATGKVLTPGLVNAHCHLELTYAQPIDKHPKDTMADWLLAVVQQSRQNPELKYDRCQQGIQQSLRYGVTCFNDIASDDNSFKALHEEGCRGRVSLEWFHPASQPVVTDSICHRLQAFQASCTSYSSTRLDIGHSPHSLYNVSPQAWQAVCQHFPHLPVHAHLAETRAELDFLAGRPSPLNELHQQLLGQTFPPQSPGNEPITLLQQSGLLQPKTVFAHAVYTTPETRTMLAKASVSIAHCPRSNLWLEGKTLHWPDWENSPTPIGLGTDSCLSNTDLDLRAEARAAMALHGWQAQQAWQIMTLGGATALNLSDHVGQLTPGKCADFVIWQYPKHLMATEASIFDITLSAGTTVAGVYCDGKQIATPQQASAEKW